MQFIFTAPDLTDPTFKTLEETAIKSFKRIEKLINKDLESTLRISVFKEGSSEFSVSVEFNYMGEVFFTKETNRDLRKAVDICSKELKTLIAKAKEKLSKLA